MKKKRTKTLKPEDLTVCNNIPEGHEVKASASLLVLLFRDELVKACTELAEKEETEKNSQD